jgi:hypothetical protein
MRVDAYFKTGFDKGFILQVDGPALTFETDSKETVAVSPASAAPGSTQAAI